MTISGLEAEKILEEIKKLKDENEVFRRPFFKKTEFWSLAVPVLTLLATTVYADWLSPNSVRQRTIFEIQRENLQLDVANLESRRNLLSIELEKFESEERRLQVEVADAKSSVEEMSRQSSCERLFRSLEEVRAIGFAFASGLSKQNLPALATIALEKGKITEKEQDALDFFQSAQPYFGWKNPEEIPDDPFKRLVYANYVADDVAETVGEVSLYYGSAEVSGFTLLQILQRKVAEYRADSFEGKALNEITSVIMASTILEEDDLLPNLDARQMLVLSSITSNEVELSPDDAEALAKEMLRTIAAHEKAVENLRFAMQSVASYCP